MMDMAKLLFGLNLSPSVTSGPDPVAQARTAEDLGFDFVSANDHVHGPDPRYEAWTMLSWIAAETSRIRVATRVLGLPYRSPAVVAKMAETFDRLSNGRLILGLGAGASDEEFRALGLEVAAFSCLTNWAAGLNPARLSHDEVLTAGAAASKAFAPLLATVFAKS